MMIKGRLTTAAICATLALAAQPVAAHNDQSTWDSMGPFTTAPGRPSVVGPSIPTVQLYNSSFDEAIRWYYDGFGETWGFFVDVPFFDIDNTVFSASIHAPSHSLSIADDGKVGYGVLNPLAPVHVISSGGTSAGSAGILVQETSATRMDRTMMMLESNGNTKFEIKDSGTGTSWAFTNTGTAFHMSYQDSGVVELRVNNQGNAFLAGSLFENSDRNAKQDIEPIDGTDVLARLKTLPITEWSYKDAPNERHIGPMAQDFRAAFGLGHDETSLATLDTAGVALAAIKALAEENEQLRTRLEGLEAQAERIEVLEAMVQRLAEQQAAPVMARLETH